MITVHCVNPECKSIFSDTYMVDSLNAPCPGCGLRGTLLQLNCIHYIHPDPKGPLISKITGGRFQFGCDNSRKGWHYGQRHPSYPIYYTPSPGAVTCYDCLKICKDNTLTEGDVILGERPCPPPVDGSQVPTSGPTTA